MLKWAGALAAVGVVGVGLGFGGDILIRPNTTKTSTQTVTTAQTETQTKVSTVQPPTKLSYIPPLSPEVQTKVDSLTSSLVSLHQDETIKYVNCGGTQCFRTCMLGVRVKNGAITGFEPDSTINRNIAMEDQYIDKKDLLDCKFQSRTCPMSYGYMAMIYDPNRVVYPMKRVGDRGSGQWQRITNDEAASTVAQMLTETVNTYGPYSIWFDPYSMYGSCGLPFNAWFNAGLAGWDAHSSNGWEQPATWVGGDSGAITDDAPDLRDQSLANLIVLWGNNPAQIQMGEWPWFLRMFREQGKPIIYLDHRYTWTSESIASQFIPIRPGTDVVMILAMANVMFKENLIDNTFISKWVEPTGFQKWKDYVLGITSGPDGKIDRTPEWAAPICGVPAVTIKAFAELYAKSKPVSLYFGGVYRQIFGENFSRGILYLQAITGNIGTPGASLGQINEPKALGLDATGSRGSVPNVDWKRATATYTAPLLGAGMKWAASIYLRQQWQAGQISEADYYGKMGLPLGFSKSDIQMLIFENGDVGTTVQTSSVAQAVKSVKYVVAVTQETYRPSAMYADILVPQAYGMFESRQARIGNTASSKGGKNWMIRLTDWGAWFYSQKCIDPPGECTAPDYFWLQVAKKLGIADKYQPLLYDVTSPQEWDQRMESIQQQAYEDWATSPGVQPLNPPSWADFQKKPIWRWPTIDSTYQCKTTIGQGQTPFSTDSQLMEFVSPVLANGPEWLAKNGVYPPGSGRSYGPGNLAVMAEWQSGAGDHFYSPDTTKYPINFSTPHSYYRQHSFLDNNPLLQDTYRHAAWISVADAQQRGIKDGDLVHIYNDQGEMIIPAYVTSRVVPGTGAIFETSFYTPNSTKTASMPLGIDVRGSCNDICRDIDIPFTVVGYYNCHGQAQVEKYTGTTT
jgi:anaerobic dimethyl sulfoxide reductase subunit A